MRGEAATDSIDGATPTVFQRSETTHALGSLHNGRELNGPLLGTDENADAAAK
ncbi:hypothetical protein AAVH_25267, partial [Aphelenchoides avenae]